MRIIQLPENLNPKNLYGNYSEVKNYESLIGGQIHKIYIGYGFTTGSIRKNNKPIINFVYDKNKYLMYLCKSTEEYENLKSEKKIYGNPSKYLPSHNDEFMNSIEIYSQDIKITPIKNASKNKKYVEQIDLELIPGLWRRAIINKNTGYVTFQFSFDRGRYSVGGYLDAHSKLFEAYENDVHVYKKYLELHKDEAKVIEEVNFVEEDFRDNYIKKMMENISDRFETKKHTRESLIRDLESVISVLNTYK